MWNRLMEMRVNIGLSQQEAATRLGMSRQVYNNYELAKREPAYGVLKQLALFYNTTASYLIGEIDDPNPPCANISATTNDFGELLKVLSERSEVEEVLNLIKVAKKEDVELIGVLLRRLIMNGVADVTDT